MKHLWKLGGGICMGLYLLMIPAKAETDQSSKVHALQPITVTAQKVEQDSQRVPGSVSAASGVVLEEKKIEKVYEFLNHVPNVIVQKNSTDNYITMRGISPFSTSLFSQVGVYVDGISYPIHQMQPLDLMDINRIEVLKGPQGTLYGRNTESGVLNIITNTPTNIFEGKVFTDVGFWTSSGNRPIFEEGAVVNLPLVEDTLAMRVSLQHKYTDGFMKNLANSQPPARENNFHGRAVTAWTPHEDLNVSFIVESQNKCDGLGVYRSIDGPGKTKRNALAWNQKNHVILDADVEALQIKYAAPYFDVSSTTGRHSFRQSWETDMDMGPYDSFGDKYSRDAAKTKMTILSEELRLASRPEEGRMFDWLTGLYLYHEKIDLERGGTMYLHTDQQNKGAAVFAQGTLHFWDRWHFTLGGRVEHMELQATKNMKLMDKKIDKKLQFTEFLPSSTLAFDITKDIMTYAKVSKGFFSGGYDYYFAHEKNKFSYDPEYSWNYELGLKSKWLDNRLLFNLTGFYIDVKDKQVVETINVFERKIHNAAKARSYGLEIESQYAVMPELTLSAASGLLKSEITSWKTDGDKPFDYAGKNTPGSPHLTYALGARYQAANGFFIGADVTGKSSYYADAENDLKVKEHFIVNAQTGWVGDEVEVTLWAKNLLDKNYASHKFYWASHIIQQGEPLSYGLRITYNF